MADRKTQKLLDGLQQDLERELTAVLQYTFQSSMVLGLRSTTLAPYLRQAAQRTLEHAGFLCDQIVNLGGAPKLTVPKYSDTRDLKQMLENDLDRERETILEHRERAKQAETAGEIGLKIRLEERLAAKTDHVHELERLLRGWPSE